MTAQTTLTPNELLALIEDSLTGAAPDFSSVEKHAQELVDFLGSDAREAAILDERSGIPAERLAALYGALARGLGYDEDADDEASPSLRVLETDKSAVGSAFARLCIGLRREASIALEDLRDLEEKPAELVEQLREDPDVEAFLREEPSLEWLMRRGLTPVRVLAATNSLGLLVSRMRLTSATPQNEAYITFDGRLCAGNGAEVEAARVREEIERAAWAAPPAAQALLRWILAVAREHPNVIRDYVAEESEDGTTLRLQFNNAYPADLDVRWAPSAEERAPEPVQEAVAADGASRSQQRTRQHEAPDELTPSLLPGFLQSLVSPPIGPRQRLAMITSLLVVASLVFAFAPTPGSQFVGLVDAHSRGPSLGLFASATPVPRRGELGAVALASRDTSDVLPVQTKLVVADIDRRGLTPWGTVRFRLADAEREYKSEAFTAFLDRVPRLLLAFKDAAQGALAEGHDEFLAPKQLLVQLDADRFEGSTRYVEATNALYHFRAVEAREHLEAAIAAGLSDAATYLRLSEALAELGHAADSAAAAEKARSIAEADPEVPRETKRLIQARASAAVGDWDAALALYEELAEVSSPEAWYLLQMAEVLISAGRGQEALDTLASVRPRVAGTPLASREALVAAVAASLISDWNAQRDAADRAVKLAQEADAPFIQGRALVLLGYAELPLGEKESAVAHLERARSIFDELGNVSGAAHALTVQGLKVARLDGRDLEARSYFERASQLYGEVGNRHGKAWANVYLANTYKGPSARPKARELYASAISTFRDPTGEYHIPGEPAYRRGLPLALSGLASIEIEEGNLEAAQEYSFDGARVSRQMGYLEGQVAALERLAFIRSQRLSFPEAHASLDEALRLRQSAGNLSGEAILRRSRGELLLAEGRFVEAAKELSFALEYQLTKKETIEVAKTRVGLARLALAENQHQQAEDLARSATQVLQGSNHVMAALDANVVLVEALLAHQRVGDARLAAVQIDETLRSHPELLEHFLLKLQTNLVRARFDAAVGDRKSALDVFRRVADEARARAAESLRLEAQLGQAELEILLGQPSGRHLLQATRAEAATSGFGLLERTAERLGDDRIPGPAVSGSGP